MKNWWQRRSLRFRLALWYAGGGTLLLTAFSATLYLFVSSRMAQPLDRQLRLDLDEIRQRLTVQGRSHVLWDGREVRNNADWNADDPWFELWDENGQLVRRLWPFSRRRIETLPVAPVPGRETLSLFYVARDIRLRVLSVPYPVGADEKPWMIRVMSVHERAADALGALGWIMLITLPIVVVVLVSGGFIVTRRWLAPLDKMVAEADRITAQDLSRRLPVANPHDELGRVATVFNITLDRLERSFTALDRFAADASHELRTPLTTLRSVGEVGLRSERSSEEYREIIGSMLEEAQRLQLLVQRLLELATAEGGSPQVQLKQIRVDEYVTACVNEMAVLAEYRGQRFELATTPCEVVTDPVLFRQALQNLLDNATKYSPDGAAIRVAVADEPARCMVTVCDEGPGISEENQARLAERFFRPAAVRGHGKGGFGLGLSITQAYMRLVGGALSYEPAQPCGSIFRLSLPKP